MAYSRGAIHPSEHQLLIGSIRHAAEKTNHRVFLEIGVFRAQTSKCVAQVLCDMKRKATVFGIDNNRNSVKHWRGRCAGYTRNNHILEYRFYLGSLDSIVSYEIGSGQCAWIFIDGSRTYNQFKSDLSHSLWLLGAGGVLAVHNIGIPDVQRALDEADIGQYGFEPWGQIGGVPKVRSGLSVYTLNKEAEDG